MTQETETTSQSTKGICISAKMQEHLQGVLEQQGGGRNKYGHRLGRQAAFIDEQLEQGKSVDEIVEAWGRQHPDKKMARARVMEEIKHLLDEHNAGVSTKKVRHTERQKPQV